ncbi:MAG: molecular chaperone TorD family protein [Magnetococcales bacterium]|nr:molecular chaperone TorD family protein [Magnetococcales bacterium]
MNEQQDVALAHTLHMSLQRAAAYRALARGFFYPSVEVHAEIEQLLSDLMAAHSGWPSDLDRSLHDCLNSFRDDSLELLQPEYLRLFGPIAKAPLTETSYGDAYRLLGKAANLSDIAGFYLAFGVKPSLGGGHQESLPEDHLAMELEFMSLLNAKEAIAVHEGWLEEAEITRDAMVKFLQEHLGAWMEPWSSLLFASAPPAFYNNLVQTLLALIRHDLNRLAIEPVAILSRTVDTEVGGDEMICPMSIPSA